MDIAEKNGNKRIFGIAADGEGDRFYVEEGRIKVKLSPYDDMLKKYSDLDIPHFDVPSGKEFFHAQLDEFKSRKDPFATIEQLEHMMGLISAGAFEVHSYSGGKRKHEVGFDMGL